MDKRWTKLDRVDINYLFLLFRLFAWGPISLLSKKRCQNTFWFNESRPNLKFSWISLCLMRDRFISLYSILLNWFVRYVVWKRKGTILFLWRNIVLRWHNFSSVYNTNDKFCLKVFIIIIYIFCNNKKYITK